MATLDEKIAACFLETNRQWEFHEKLVPALEKPRGPKGRPAPRGTVDTAASVDAGARTEALRGGRELPQKSSQESARQVPRRTRNTGHRKAASDEATVEQVSVKISPEEGKSSVLSSASDETRTRKAPVSSEIRPGSARRRVLAKESAAPVKESAAPVEDSAAPVKESAAPVKETAGSVKERAAHVKEPATPSKSAARVPRVSPRPKEKAFSPADRAGETSEAASSANDVVVVRVTSPARANNRVPRRGPGERSPSAKLQQEVIAEEPRVMTVPAAASYASLPADISIASFAREPMFAQEEEEEGSDVILHVYDLHKMTKFAALAIYHTGVELHGRELAFGTDGIQWNKPACMGNHVHKRRVPLGRTELSRREVDIIVERLRAQWPGSDYSLFNRNCQTFSIEFVKHLRLEKGIPPEFVRFSNWGRPRSQSRSERSAHQRPKSPASRPSSFR